MDRSDWCPCCGKRDAMSNPSMCTKCTRVICETCTVDYKDKETNRERVLCEDCHDKKTEELKEEEESKRRKEMYLYGKILLVSLVILFFLSLVIKW